MKYQECPFCKNKFHSNNSKHPYICSLKNGFILNKNEIRIEIVKTNFPKLYDKNYLNKIYITQRNSLNKIVKDYNINRKQLENLLIYYGFHLKSYSEGAKDSLDAKKKTNLIRYGVENPSQRIDIKEKKKQTFVKNYGVNNIRKSKVFYKNIAIKIQEKYGMSKSKLASIKAKELWASKSDIEKENWLNNSIHKKRNFKRQGVVISKAENKISSLCIELNLNIETSFTIYYNKRNRFVYDILLKDHNTIIEYNGDLYHANPEIYKCSDILTFPVKRTAKDIWIKDEIKKEFALNHGFTIIYIWEKEFKENKFNLKNFLTQKLKNYGLQIS